MRIAVIADTHLTVPEIESCSLFPRQLATLDKEEAEALYQKMRDELQLAYSTCLDWLRKKRSWQLLIHLGDVTGGWKEQGSHHPSVQQLLQGVKKDLQDLAPKVRFVLGDHDTGYSHSGSLPESGINLNGIAFCRETLGDLFWTEERNGLLSIGVCSPIAEYAGLEPEIVRLKKNQSDFLGDTLLSHKGPWMFYIHRPFVLQHFVRQIKGHTERLERMVCGHFHEPKKGKFLKGITQIIRGDVARKCLRKCTFCPSTAPLWWQGYGLLALYGDKTNLQAQPVFLDRPPQSQDLPTSSFLRCAWWMTRKRKKAP